MHRARITPYIDKDGRAKMKILYIDDDGKEKVHLPVKKIEIKMSPGEVDFEVYWVDELDGHSDVTEIRARK